MRILMPLFAMLLLGAAPAPAPAPVQALPLAAMPVVDLLAAEQNCPETPMSLARKAAEKPRLRRLDELPAATMFAAVDHRVGGCTAPVVLSGQSFGR